MTYIQREAETERQDPGMTTQRGKEKLKEGSGEGLISLNTNQKMESSSPFWDLRSFQEAKAGMANWPGTSCGGSGPQEHRSLACVKMPRLSALKSSSYVPRGPGNSPGTGMLPLKLNEEKAQDPCLLPSGFKFP